MISSIILLSSCLIGLSFGSGDLGCEEVDHWAAKNCKFPNSGRCDQGRMSMWYGEKHRIPCGWRICDGEFGTPDLRHRFVIGASDNGEGSEFIQNSTGGSFTITLKLQNIPKHFHNFGESMVHVSTHTHGHEFGGTAQSSGIHGHPQSSCDVDGNGHTHGWSGTVGSSGQGTVSFSGETDEAEHQHSNCELLVNSGGDHTHGDTFDIVSTDISHSHGAGQLSAVGAVGHSHTLTLDLSLSLDAHSHGAEGLFVNDHTWSHNHGGSAVILTSSGGHSHSFSQNSNSAGIHTHEFNIEHTNESPHQHPNGGTAANSGGHTHTVPGGVTNGAGEHEHVVPAYFEEVKGTNRNDFNIAADAVDTEVECPGHSKANGTHQHTVPSRETNSGGVHGHSLIGLTGLGGGHNHDFGASTILNSGSHTHGLPDTNAVDGHTHGSEFNIATDTRTLGHTVTGNTASVEASGSASSQTTSTTTDGGHGHGITGNTASATTTHTHTLNGGITGAGSHTHGGAAACSGGLHSHNINIVNSQATVDHTHLISGEVTGNGFHNHPCSNTISQSGSHTHTVNINGGDESHTHIVYGETEEDCWQHVRDGNGNIPPYPHRPKHTGLDDGERIRAEHCAGEPFEYIPPYFATYFICCVGCDRDNQYWQALHTTTPGP